MSLVIFCLLFSFVDYVPVKGEIIWYFSLAAWLILVTIARGEWGGDSGERVFRNYYKGHMDKIKSGG